MNEKQIAEISKRITIQGLEKELRNTKWALINLSSNRYMRSGDAFVRLHEMEKSNSSRIVKKHVIKKDHHELIIKNVKTNKKLVFKIHFEDFYLYVENVDDIEKVDTYLK